MSQAETYLPQYAEPKRYIFVASTGGHLAQLVRFSNRMNARTGSIWITSPTPQSTSLLRGKDAHLLPYVGARDPIGVLRTFVAAQNIIRKGHYEAVISTGSAFALGVFAAAALHRIPRIFIESVSRVEGPSLTGRIIHALHLAKTFTQHPAWAAGRWAPHPSALSQFEARSRDAVSTEPTLFVTVGTFRKYRFDSLIDAVLGSGYANESTVWQIGATSRTDLPGRVYEEMTADEFAEATSKADVVVSHAGVGSILGFLESGIFPVLVPRRRYRSEHVDDHQLQIARLMHTLGLASVVEPSRLSRATVDYAARMGVSPIGKPRFSPDQTTDNRR